MTGYKRIVKGNTTNTGEVAVAWWRVGGVSRIDVEWWVMGDVSFPFPSLPVRFLLSVRLPRLAGGGAAAHYLPPPSGGWGRGWRRDAHAKPHSSICASVPDRLYRITGREGGDWV